MEYILIVISVLLSLISLFLIFRDIQDNEDSYTNIPSKKNIYLYSSVAIIITTIISVVLAYYNQENSFVYKVKVVLILNILWAVAFIDLKSYRIPNLFIIYGLIIRGIILIFELINYSPRTKFIVIGELVASLVLLIATLLTRFTVKNSIGYGDIKLFIIMGLTLGMTGIWDAMFLSMIVIFLISLYVIITKTKSRKDSLPFAPAIALGTYLSIILSLM